MDRRFSPGNLPLARLAIVTGATALGAAWLVRVGPVHVVRITTELEETPPFWYMLSASPVHGMLRADLLDAWRSPRLRREALVLGFQIALIVVISNLRLGARLPISGHALVAAYFLLRRLLLPRPASGRPIELAVAAVILGAVAYAKLAWWTDPVTLAAGAALAALLVLAERRLIPGAADREAAT